MFTKYLHLYLNTIECIWPQTWAWLSLNSSSVFLCIYAAYASKVWIASCKHTQLAKATWCGHVENHWFTHHQNAESLYSVCGYVMKLIIHKHNYRLNVYIQQAIQLVTFYSRSTKTKHELFFFTYCISFILDINRTVYTVWDKLWDVL